MKTYAIISFTNNNCVLAEVEIVRCHPSDKNLKNVKVKRVIINSCNFHITNDSYATSFAYLSNEVAEFESDDDAKLWFEVSK